MDKSEHEYFIRFYLLLAKGGGEVLRQIVTWGLEKQNLTLDQFLAQKKDSIESRKYIKRKEMDILYPVPPNVSDLSKWDISLLSCIALEFFQRDLNTQQIRAVEKIRDMRNEYAHNADASIDFRTYLCVFTELTLILNTMAHVCNMDEIKKEYLNEVIRNASKKENIDTNSAIEELKTLEYRDEFLRPVTESNAEILKQLLEVKKELRDLHTKFDNLGKSTDITNKSRGVINVTATDPNTEVRAETLLLAASEESVGKSSQSPESHPAVKEKVDLLVKDIEKNGVKVVDVEKGSVVFSFGCPSITTLLDLLDFFESDVMQKHLGDISSVLEDILGHEVQLATCILPASLQDALNMLRGMAETCTRSVQFSMTCEGIEGLQHAIEVFEGGSTSNPLNNLAKTLSEEVGKPVKLHTSIDIELMRTAIQSIKQELERSKSSRRFRAHRVSTYTEYKPPFDKLVKMTTTTNQAEVLRQFLSRDPKGRQSLVVPEGRYKGWVPRCLYEMKCANVCLPFLKLLSFPVGGSSLGQLVEMETFNATGNYLTRLPDSFGKCQNLVRLNLSYNHLERIPSAAFQLTNLQELDLSENEISAVHPSIGNLKKLRLLNLSGNLLDELPEELAQCERIEKLDLSRKWYPKGGFQVLPEAVCYLAELTFLDVSWHQISTITDDVKNMSKLQTLRMRGNYLKHVSSVISECKKLQYLDLTGAMKLNSYIPPEIFTLPELRILDLTNNYFTEISPAIVGLKKLKKMIMRRNALLRIPDEIFKMESLESLDLSENYLEDIPHCISELTTLKNLYLACNKIKALPEEICECRDLVELQLHYNKLEALPSEIYKLHQLEELMLEGNQLKTLPLLLDKLEKLKETERLTLYNNNLQKPPQSICDQGVASLYGYLKELRICEATHRKKLILIGASEAGKSSLRNVLILGKSKLTEVYERTWVMEQHLWEPEPDLRVQILDFGGHHIYSAAHHMFLTPEALHVLVFDLSTYKPENFDLQIGDWLDSIMDRAPGATIMIVGTHSDLCTEDQIETARDHVLGRMHEEENAKIQDLEMMLRIEQRKLADAHKKSGQKFPDLVTQRLQERVNKMQKLHITRIKLPPDIFIVSCAETLSGIINFHENLTDNLKASEGQPLPTSWFKFLTAIQDRPEKILTWSETLEIFEEVIATLKQSIYMLQGSAEKSLEMVLRYLHVTGEIVWYHENPKLRNIVFHHPETLVEMLRAIFRHDFKKVVNYVDVHGQMAGLSQGRFENLKEEFLQRGLMTNELLSYCLQHFSLSLESQEIFMDLMLKFDLCYQVTDPTSAPGTFGSKHILQFPWFLTSTPPDDFATRWPEMVPLNTIELRYQLQFLKKGLPNFFEKMSARLQSYVTHREDWMDGILATRNKCKLLLTRKKTSGLSCITLSVRGAELQDLWFLILTIRADMLALLQEWPFVKVDPYMVCAHCIATNTSPPYLWRGEILDAKCPKGLYETHCPKTSHSIPSCLIYPIDSEFPVEDINRHITTVTDFLRNNYDTVDSAGLLSDLVLSRVAAKLGFEWIRVALELGLSQANVEQIQISNKYEGAHKMIITALLKWRDNSSASNEDKIDELMEAIGNANRHDLAEELKAQYMGT